MAKNRRNLLDRMWRGPYPNTQERDALLARDIKTRLYRRRLERLGVYPRLQLILFRTEERLYHIVHEGWG